MQKSSTMIASMHAISTDPAPHMGVKGSKQVYKCTCVLQDIISLFFWIVPYSKFASLLISSLHRSLFQVCSSACSVTEGPNLSAHLLSLPCILCVYVSVCVCLVNLACDAMYLTGVCVCVYMCVCVYVCMCVCTCLASLTGDAMYLTGFVCVCMYACVCVYVRACVYVCVCMCLVKLTCDAMYLTSCVCVYVCVRAYVCVRDYHNRCESYSYPPGERTPGNLSDHNTAAETGVAGCLALQSQQSRYLRNHAILSQNTQTHRHMYTHT